MVSPNDLQSTDTIREQIRELESLDLKTVDDVLIYQRILRLMSAYVGRQTGINTSRRVYRVRKNSEERLKSNRGFEWYPALFSEVRQLWYPPPELSRTRGRIDPAGESVFYCATSINTAVLEVRPKPGEYLTIMECAFANEAVEPNIFEAGVREGPGSFNPNYGDSSPEDDNQYQAYLREQGISEATQLIREFLVKQFVKVVEPEAEYEYKITNAIGTVLLTEFDFRRKSDFVPVDLEADGIAYASIAAENKDANIAFTRAAADRLLKAVACGVFIVGEDDNRPYPEIRRTHRAKAITVDGYIEW